jgi:hypothetical protein
VLILDVETADDPGCSDGVPQAAVVNTMKHNPATTDFNIILILHSFDP